VWPISLVSLKDCISCGILSGEILPQRKRHAIQLPVLSQAVFSIRLTNCQIFSCACLLIVERVVRGVRDDRTLQQGCSFIKCWSCAKWTVLYPLSLQAPITDIKLMLTCLVWLFS
jgi:hypothetical protein